jgi:1,2-phenylacetyl-CoA epoxidase PaaB subunit
MHACEIESVADLCASLFIDQHDERLRCWQEMFSRRSRIITIFAVVVNEVAVRVPQECSADENRAMHMIRTYCNEREDQDIRFADSLLATSTQIIIFDDDFVGLLNPDPLSLSLEVLRS